VRLQLRVFPLHYRTLAKDVIATQHVANPVLRHSQKLTINGELHQQRRQQTQGQYQQ